MKIKISNTVSMDLDKLIESRLLIQANSGGGKSWTNRRIIEQAFGHVQIIVIDPEGEFGNMRGKYDFVYAGKGGDAPVECRSAALLARRLLELEVSAIIDLYELPMQERKHFVRLFLDSMVNAPKELWHDCIVILDEAHKFAPEKEQSEALESVADMASRGRKRGYCLIPATQRPAKLNKDVAAECNNKIIGRASLDIDRKRSAEELGFTTREEIISLRNLEPGEFYCFGPAISREIVKTKIGEISVPMQKRGQTGRALPLPTANIKSILGKLADLPKEAAEEAKTISELKAQIIYLKTANNTFARNAIKNPVEDIAFRKGVEESRKIDAGTIKQLDAQVKILVGERNFAIKNITPIQKALSDIVNLAVEAKKLAIMPPLIMQKTPTFSRIPDREIFDVPTYRYEENKESTDFGKGEMAVLNAIAQDEEGISTEHLAILTGYKATSRRVYTNNLIRAGYINKNDDIFHVTDVGRDALGSNFKALPEGSELREHMLKILPEGERKLFQMIVYSYPKYLTRAELQEGTGYKATSVRVYVNKLAARKIVVTHQDRVGMNKKLE